jgi:hypothetical protein
MPKLLPPPRNAKYKSGCKVWLTFEMEPFARTTWYYDRSLAYLYARASTLFKYINILASTLDALLCQFDPASLEILKSSLQENEKNLNKKMLDFF